MAEGNNLLDVWEWNMVTGDPFFPPEESLHSLYCPAVAEIDEIVHGLNVTSQYLKTRLVTFMSSNATQQGTVFDVSRNSSEVLSFLRLLRGLDFKKIRVNYISGGHLFIAKLPRDTPFTGEPDGVLHQIRNAKNTSVFGLADDINHNSMLGWLGPGTFPCHHPLCVWCTRVGRTPTVNLGTHGQLNLTKRATCYTKNAVYVGVCSQCERDGNWACYFGETSQTLRKRCSVYLSSPCNCSSILKEQTTAQRRAEIQTVLANGVDPQGILMDWFCHVTEGGIHPGQQRMSVVDIIPHTFFRKLREMNLVAENMIENGDIHYLGLGQGCLNTYHEN